ncbi:hypothetical protein FBY31_4581 [Arthrobacter sp. SLBN-100]|nr:hypothetical protein [Arthrobacter sp. SLBN-100]TQJ62185.1 hypothetical protein FBY31_4581 [Arthrobacter sp. SLBN-100]
MVKDGWRTTPRGALAYLEFLEGLGHQLTPIEEVMVRGRIADQVFDLD